MCLYSVERKHVTIRGKNLSKPGMWLESSDAGSTYHMRKEGTAKSEKKIRQFARKYGS
jgi:hypothetical protein